MRGHASFDPLFQPCSYLFRQSHSITKFMYFSLCNKDPSTVKFRASCSLFPLSDEAFCCQAYASTRSVCFLLPHQLSASHIRYIMICFLFRPFFQYLEWWMNTCCPLSCHLFIHQQPTPKHTLGKATHFKDRPLWRQIISGKSQISANSEKKIKVK